MSQVPSQPGSNPDQETWMREHVESVREVVAKGAHSSLYYPACGSDTVRAMVAYDADTVVATDDRVDVLDGVQRELVVYGIEDAVIDRHETYQDVDFTFEGKQRHIRYILGDAREIDPTIPKTDIYHVYLPNEAAHDINEADGTTIYPGIKELLTPAVYRRVNTGGFFVLSENRLGYMNSDIPASLLAVAGIEEHIATERHPLTVRTTLYPTEEEIAQKDRRSWIYQKTEEETPEMVELSLLGLGILSDVEYTSWVLSQFSDELFLGSADRDEAVNDYLSEQQTRFRDALVNWRREAEARGLGEDGSDQVVADMRAARSEILRRVQTDFEAYLDTYQSLVDEMSQGRELSGEEVQERFGMKYNKDTRVLECARWPFAPTVLSGDAEQQQAWNDAINNAAAAIEFFT